MATSFKYRFGKALGLVLVMAYVAAVILITLGAIEAAKHHLGRSEWYIILAVVILCIAALRFIPRPVDVLLLAPLGAYGISIGWGLPWMIAGMIVAIPVLIIVLLSFGKK